MAKQYTSNDMRSNVKNPNNAAYTADKANHEAQVTATEGTGAAQPTVPQPAAPAPKAEK